MLVFDDPQLKRLLLLGLAPEVDITGEVEDQTWFRGVIRRVRSSQRPLNPDIPEANRDLAPRR